METPTAIAVIIGGGIGSLLRYLLSGCVAPFTRLPLGTLISNTISCLILVGSYAWLEQKPDAAPWLKFFLMAGVCGGFSTFSTFSLETAQLIKSGMLSYALLNIVFNISICLAICYYLIKN